ncbi:hypothetical protein H0H81_006504 [Sphagnurus paluster]|uniref:Uncharacterized protein n=1 Tax=Sphagnurus paluster TaxID=117069 RepID=A0A9P7K5G2_9AGAR|nr:hypothetical protein H0H81_006504 [Sphagnurus paluster]
MYKYRSGYSYKDKNQEHILALKMKHEHFRELLSFASVTTNGHLTEEEKAKPVRVQWDPERSPALDALPYRSIQIGISAAISPTWIEQWIVSIEDVTATARALKAAIDDDSEWTLGDLVLRGLVPLELEYEITEELKTILKMI